MRYADVYTASTAILFGLCAVSLLPLIILYLEFRGPEFCGEPYWFYIAKFYGSYFLFPIFGILCAAFLVSPFATLWLILKQTQCRSIYRRTLSALASLVVLACVIEFTGSPHAAFEVPPQASSSVEAQRFYEKFSTICTSSFVYKNKFEGTEDSYQTELAKALSSGSGRSYSGYVYFLAVPAQATLLLLLLCGFYLIIFFKKTYIVSFLERERLYWERDNVFVLFGLALVVGSVWCLYRISYRVDNIGFFGVSNNPLYADYVVFGLYLFVVTIYIVFAGFDLEKIAKTGSQVASAAAVIGLSLTAPTGLAGHFFGIQASFQNLVAALIVLLLFVGVGLVFNNSPPPLPPLREEDG